MMMEPVRKRVFIRRVRWALCIIAPVLVLWGLAADPLGFSGGSTTGWGFGTSPRASKVGELLGGELLIYEQRWGHGPVWRVDVAMTLEEEICTELKDGRVTGMDERLYEVIAIPQPYTLELRDRRTGAVLQRTFLEGDPLFADLSITWSADGRQMQRNSRGIVYAPGVHYDVDAMKQLGISVLLRATAVTMIVVLLIMLLTAERLWIRVEAWKCPTCGYDLRGTSGGDAGCSECGWNRGEAVGDQQSP